MINACKLTGGINVFFLGSYFELVRKHSNFTLKCPYKKGFYVFKDQNADLIKIPLKNLKFYAEFTVFGLTKNERTKRPILYFRFYGDYDM